MWKHGDEVTKIRRFGRHIPAAVRDAIMIRHGFRCATPGCTNWAHLEIDHKTPVRAGGETSTTNLDPLCRPCHLAKTAADRQTYRNSTFFDDTG